MPVISDWSQPIADDGTLKIALSPAIPIGGMSLRFTMDGRFGGIAASSLIVLSAASGYNGVSGLTIVNSGQGILQANVSAAIKSGWNQGAYAFLVQRLDSGSITTLAEGYGLLY